MSLRKTFFHGGAGEPAVEREWKGSPFALDFEAWGSGSVKKGEKVVPG